jgi:murein DD-endopeptidase MepM/ murein hydrolase activator NlpD
MVTALWTATVRAIAVLTALLAIGVIIVSIQAARAQAGPAGSTAERVASSDGGSQTDATLGEPTLDGSESEAGAPVPSSDALAPAQSLQPVLANAETAPVPATSQTAPAMRYPAPSEALPTTRARSVSGQAHISARPQSSAPVNRPLTAVLDVGASAPASVVEATLLAKQSLEFQGYQVSLLKEEDDANGAGPLRPDAYVSIRTVTSADATASAEAWFCNVDGSLSGQLAELLLKELSAAGLPNVGQGDGKITDPDAFRCGDLLGGRARMPAVLVEMPALATGDGAMQALAQGLAGGIHQFFQSHGAALLQEEQRQRLVWPALGPITSYFGPSHPLGIDIGQSEGSVVAATDGVVLFAGGDPCCSYGLYVVVESPDGITTVYGHLDSIAVAAGQRVRQGQSLGEVGCTGHCYGTHLHFEVIDNGVRRDPLLYLP